MTRKPGWYEAVDAPPELASVLACSWTATPIGRHRLTPDACVDIVVLDSGLALLCGPERRSWSFELPAGTTSVGVRFRPGMAGLAFDVDLAEIGDARIPIDDLLGTGFVEALERDLAVIDDLDGRRRALEAWCIKRWCGLEPDPVAEEILAWASSVPHRSLGGLDRQLGLSERSLRRRCRQRFGYPPSTLTRIVRFQRFCAAADRLGGQVTLADLAAEAGYADQAHLGRDCRAITSQTPLAFLADYFATFPDMSDPFKTSSLGEPTMA